MMINYTKILILVLLSIPLSAQVKPVDTQIEEALLAVPEPLRVGAKVYGFDKSGTFVELRAGSNEMVCIADDPSIQGFGIASYHVELDEFMARGRQLKDEGKGFQEIFETRESEVKSGKLKMPERSLLTVMTGEYDESGTPTNLYTRYVFYIPYATAESTGLPTSPVGPASPWIMDPGTHRAHIMINPPKN